MPVNKEHDEFYAVDLGSGWETPPGYPRGIEQKILAGSLDEESRRGTRTRLLRFAPGVFTTQPVRPRVLGGGVPGRGRADRRQRQPRATAANCSYRTRMPAGRRARRTARSNRSGLPAARDPLLRPGLTPTLCAAARRPWRRAARHRRSWSTRAWSGLPTPTARAGVCSAQSTPRVRAKQPVPWMPFAGSARSRPRMRASRFRSRICLTSGDSPPAPARLPSTPHRQRAMRRQSRAGAVPASLLSAGPT